jgi:hypothetical protein
LKLEGANPSNKPRFIPAIFGALFGLLLSLPILALGLPFWIAGLCTRWIGALLEPRFLPWSSIVGFDPLIGWRPKPNLKVYGLADEVFRMTTGADGWPGNTSMAEADLVVLGDSFAFGYGINDKAMFARLIPQVRVKPIGSPAYNLVQELMILRQYSSQLAGKLIVWFVFLGNDLWDNLYPYTHMYSTPFARRTNNRGDWRIENSHVSPKTRPYEYDAKHDRIIWDRLADVCSSSHLSERAYSACEFLISEAQEICERHGARLCVFTIPDSAQLSPERLEDLRARSSNPDSFDPGFPDRKLSEICSNRGVAFLAGREHLTRADYRQVDRHWNERGHQRIAEILGNLYRAHRPEQART